jgi:hypothetical protein
MPGSTGYRAPQDSRKTPGQYSTHGELFALLMGGFFARRFIAPSV